MQVREDLKMSDMLSNQQCLNLLRNSSVTAKLFYLWYSKASDNTHMKNFIKWWLTHLVRNMWFLSLSINYINIVADVFSELVSKKKKTQNIVYLGKYSTNSISWFPYQRTTNFSTSSWKHTSNTIWSWPEKWPHSNPISSWGICSSQEPSRVPFPPLVSSHSPL